MLFPAVCLDFLPCYCMITHWLPPNRCLWSTIG